MKLKKVEMKELRGREDRKELKKKQGEELKPYPGRL